MITASIGAVGFLKSVIYFLIYEVKSRLQNNLFCQDVVSYLGGVKRRDNNQVAQTCYSSGSSQLYVLVLHARYITET
jgi:hypothetical protein